MRSSMTKRQLVVGWILAGWIVGGWTAMALRLAEEGKTSASTAHDFSFSPHWKWANSFTFMLSERQGNNVAPTTAVTDGMFTAKDTTLKDTASVSSLGASA